MSGSTTDAGAVAKSAATVAGSAAMLPFTGGNHISLLIALLALIASTAVLTAVIIKRLIVKA